MKNLKEVLISATQYPAAIEAKLPAGTPKVSTMLLDAAAKLPAVPDFPIEVPALPAAPELPALPAGLGRMGNQRYVSRATVTQVGDGRIVREITPSPATGVIPEVSTRRGM